MPTSRQTGYTPTGLTAVGATTFPTTTTSVEVFSDAPGSSGCGALASSLGWFQLQWPQDWHAIHITAKQLVPIVLAAALWGPQWTRRHIAFRWDNMAVVELLKSCTSQDPLLMHMSCCLAFY